MTSWSRSFPSASMSLMRARASFWRRYGSHSAGVERHRPSAARGPHQESAGQATAGGRSRTRTSGQNRQGVENEGQNGEIRPEQSRGPEVSLAQNGSRAEVDETTLNPLITRIQVERSNDTGR